MSRGRSSSQVSVKCTLYPIQSVDRFLAAAEMDVLTQVMYDARGRAMSRMSKEASALDADGVVGVRIEVTRHGGNEALAEFVAIGTAIRACDSESFRNAGGKFFHSPSCSITNPEVSYHRF